MITALFILVLLGIVAFGTKIAIDGGVDPLDVCALAVCSFIGGFVLQQIV